MPSAVAATRAVVLAAIPGIVVANRLPSTLPRRCVRVSRAGGPRGRDLDVPTMLVECYASTADKEPDGPQAEQDAYAVVDALRRAGSGGPWAGAWITGFGGPNGRGISVVDFEDLDQPSHARWQITGSLYLLT